MLLYHGLKARGYLPVPLRGLPSDSVLRLFTAVALEGHPAVRARCRGFPGRKDDIVPVFRLGRNRDPFRDLEREVDRLLRGMDFSIERFRTGRRYPAINVYELEDRYVLTAELPGTLVEELDITVAGGVLTLCGRRNDSESVADEHYRRQERFRGDWQRSLTLPERVDESSMTAEFNNGVLKVTLPRGSELKPRQIPVTEGGD